VSLVGGAGRDPPGENVELPRARLPTGFRGQHLDVRVGGLHPQPELAYLGATRATSVAGRHLSRIRCSRKNQDTSMAHGSARDDARKLS